MRTLKFRSIFSSVYLKERGKCVRVSHTRNTLNRPTVSFERSLCVSMPSGKVFSHQMLISDCGSRNEPYPRTKSHTKQLLSAMKGGHLFQYTNQCFCESSIHSLDRSSTGKTVFSTFPFLFSGEVLAQRQQVCLMWIRLKSIQVFLSKRLEIRDSQNLPKLVVHSETRWQISPAEDFKPLVECPSFASEIGPVNSC